MTNNLMAYPFAGVRVLDLSSGIAGGYCTKLLGDAGAEVLKVEPATGDGLRRHGVGPRAGLLFAFLHASKRSAVLSDDQIRSLYDQVDLVIENGGPGALAARDLGPDTLARLCPAATMLSISPFGHTGPWAARAATEFTLLAAGGATSTRAAPGREFLNGGGRIGEWMGGVTAAVAAAAALRRAQRCGLGDHIDLSLLETVTPTCSNVQTLWGSMSGNFEAAPRLEVPSIEPSADGFVGFCIFTGQQWKDFALLIGRPELGDDPDLATMGGRIERSSWLQPIVRAYTESRTTAEILEEGSALRIPVAPLGNGANLCGFDQFVERDVYVDHPGGDFKQPRVPWTMSGLPRRPFGASPELGADTAAVVEGRPWAAPRRADTADTTAIDGGVTADAWPLDGVRVVDLTAFWAGPYATFALAGLGADVIHVESVQRPDGMRFGSVRPPTTDQWWEWGPTFHSANANKRSVTLDLGRERGRAVLRRLVEVSDVLIENYSPRVLEQWGLTWDRLRAWNPRLVFVRMPAFGLDGPWRDRVGFAQTMEQLSGMAWLTGYGDTEPMNARGPCDPLAGLHASFATIAALARREQTGEGCLVEATMVETALNAAAEQVIEYTGNGVLLTRDGNREPHYGLQGTFATADCPADTMGAIAIAAETTDQRFALSEIVGTAIADQSGFEAALAPWCAERLLLDTVELLAAAGVPAAAVAGCRVSDRNPQIGTRGFLELVEHDIIGTHAIPAMPVVFGRQPGTRFRRPAPMLGEHNGEVLGGLLGIDAATLDDLRADQIIGDRPLGLS